MAATKNISHTRHTATDLAETAAAMHTPRQKHRLEVRKMEDVGKEDLEDNNREDEDIYEECRGHGDNFD